MMYPYPQVHDEFETIAACASGKSLARLGDGEIKLVHGRSAMREPPNKQLARELLDVLQRPNPGVCVGIPTMDQRGPKYQNWTKHAVPFMQVLVPEVTYYSAFVSRPDSAPWIETAEYARSVVNLWAGKRVVLVCEREGFILNLIARTSDNWLHVECPMREAYAEIKHLHRKCLRHGADIAILSAGPAATCLANRLAGNGLQAIDLGSAGRFLYRTLWPEEYAQKYAAKGEGGN